MNFYLKILQTGRDYICHKTLIITALCAWGGYTLPCAGAERTDTLNRDSGLNCASALRWAIGTNLPAWGMAIANLSGEVQINHRWSTALSIYYSAWNYGAPDRKFRTFILRPEARYWTRSASQGLYVQAHLQMASYNFALPSWNYRIQDRGGTNPALGGGLGIGYRLPLGNSRWALDTSLGFGVYHLKYDRFENYDNGPLVDTRSRAWCGIDHVGLGIIYNFNSAP